MSATDVLASLTAPGQPFEIVVGDDGRKAFARPGGSLRDLVVRAAQRGEAEFLVSGDQRVSFADFARRVWGAARALTDGLGVRPGDRVGLLGPSSIDWIVVAFGAASAGIALVPLNDQWSTAELQHAADDAGLAVLLVDRRWRGTPPDGVRLVELGSGDLTRDVHEAADPPTTPLADDDPFAILYTSGTTGRPKGCITTHGGTIAQIRAVLLGALVDAGGGGGTGGGARRQPALLLTVPLFHVSGLHAAVCLSMLIGAKVVLDEERFDPERVVRLIEQERITSWGGVPTMLRRVLACPAAAEADLSSLEVVSIGGAPLGPETVGRAQSFLGGGRRLGNGYGLTETHGPVTMNAGEDLRSRPGSVGRPLPILDISIVDEGGEEVRPGDVGEICISGPTTTPGYWNDPAATAAAVDGRWLRTGDLGWLDEEGNLYIADRAKDLIIRGGENVYSAEVEHCIEALPGVVEAAVIGVPDDDLGERVQAVVRLDGTSSVTAHELREDVARQLARYKVPDVVYLVDEALPRNAAGKVVKRDVRALVESLASGRAAPR